MNKQGEKLTKVGWMTPLSLYIKRYGRKHKEKGKKLIRVGKMMPVSLYIKQYVSKSKDKSCNKRQNT